MERRQRDQLLLAAILVAVGALFVSQAGWVFGTLGVGVFFGFIMLIIGSFRWLVAPHKQHIVTMVIGMTMMVPLPAVWLVSQNNGRPLVQAAIALAAAAILLVFLQIIRKTPIN